MSSVNKKYHVYGIGNALVDYEYLIEESVLKDFNLQKSSMMLVDENLRGTLIEKLKNFKKKKGGGSAANTLIALAQLGANVCYSCKVADDRDGEFYLKDLITQGVDHHVQKNQLEHGVTGSCIVLVSHDAERTMCTYLGATADYSSKEINWDHLKNAQYLYIEGYLFCSDKGTEAAMAAMEFAKKNNIKIALTCSDAGVVNAFRARFNQVMANGIDLIFCNEAEAFALTQSTDIGMALEKIKTWSNHIVITRSAKGVILWDGEKTYEVMGRSVVPKDANGAGDMFAGAYIYGLTHKFGSKKAAEFACHCASEVIQVYGPRLEKDNMMDIVSKYL